jgi:hypothetical protein
MLCFVSFWRNFVKSAKRNEILPHIGICTICIYLDVCVQNFADKFLQTDYFASAKFLPKFWQNKPRICHLVLQFQFDKISIRLKYFLSGETLHISSHLTSGCVEGLAHTLFLWRPKNTLNEFNSRRPNPHVTSYNKQSLAEHWGVLPATRLVSREILIVQNIKKLTGPALWLLCGVKHDSLILNTVRVLISQYLIKGIGSWDLKLFKNNFPKRT